MCSEYQTVLHGVAALDSLGPRPSPIRVIIVRVLIVRGREHLKLGKAWDEASREGRRWVDTQRAPLTSATYMYILARAEFDVHVSLRDPARIPYVVYSKCARAKQPFLPALPNI